MGWSLTIGRIAGTSVRLHVTFLLFLAWIGVSDYLTGGPAAALSSLVFILLIFACVVAHEFGHILTARRFGVKTPEVILSPIGGIANMDRIPDNPRQELLVAVAGPLVNVAIAALLILAGGLSFGQFRAIDFETSSLVERLAFVNVSLVAFNLIPAFPMDGGRVLRALLAMAVGHQKATGLAARIGQGFAFLFVVLGLFYNPILLLVGVFVYIAAASEEQATSFRAFATSLAVRDALETSPAILAEAAPLSDAVNALLATPQHEFPVVDQAGRPVGMLDRDSLFRSLQHSDAQTAVRSIMRPGDTVRLDDRLTDAMNRMQASGAKAMIAVDGGGKVAGLLTVENVAEMLMIHNANPAWTFTRRGGPA